MTTAATVSHRIGVRRLLALLGGRATFRLLLYGSAGILVAAWSKDDFNRYAAVMGAVGWLCMLVQSGTEKAALKLIPRARRTRDQLAGMLRAVVAYVPLPFTLAAVVALVVAPGGTVTLYLLGIAYYVTLGCGSLGVAVHRALGRYTRDTVHFALLGVGMVIMAWAAFAVPVRPVGYLAGLLALTTALNLSLLPGLPRTARPRRSLRTLLAGTVVLMGVADVLANAMIGTLFVELSLTVHAGQSGDLYLVVLAWGFAVSVIYTVQRIYQPRLSVLIASGGSGARALGRRVIGVAGWVSAVWLVAGGAAIVLGLSGLVGLGCLLATLLPSIGLVSFGVFVLENSGEDGLRSSVKAVVLALVVVTAVGALTVPLYGAAGAVYALGANPLVIALALRRAG
ncbi:hypothetical protein ACIBG8_40210 [Nonomuraea sp. NPDC050556]|uniref:hypothetical protein n=1 Tax=Nonomuraea sp. NPDC050556 TaxID=3364369 RepID=UPI0037A40E1B